MRTTLSRCKIEGPTAVVIVVVPARWQRPDYAGERASIEVSRVYSTKNSEEKMTPIPFLLSECCARRLSS